ncbi:Fe-dependent oxidoreductase, alcohol dehydrogenase [Desulfocapsa sulfexigens DSM 10523]|uniref:Fe-dependent oxidoreductase, alcohol dehydrogenase n=1 Tax=Desulfocapsa sulfexigens (strain DSM 10523 / SB164P1) TaxID=1167006 RepID=M1PC02_DESSD|nr:iron-containing alcohol dehydrogenase [Desulfocapsa sulfexigens]AGF79162.1 Fe-dependent oxidoreductase, alcohol dehydrogenase [Desulfocapsa sulfexigens DSM 10523]
MQNFVFHNPTKILFGKNTVSSIGEETLLFGKNVLLVYGSGSIKKNGLYKEVTQSLGAAGATITEHGGVQSNPLLSHVQVGIQLAKDNKCDVICAVGGGSVIDEAKAICAGATVQHDVWKFFTGKKSIKSTLPLTTVLTLAASGSEMNSGMVITNETTSQKFGFANKLLFPKTSILDPAVTCSVPADYTAYGAVDAVAHVLEFYFTKEDPYTPVQDRLMEGLVINAMESCNRVLNTPNDYQARADLMWTATLALNGLTGAGLGKVGFPMHMIEHSLSAFYNVPHGAGLSAIIPGWMRYHAATKPQRFSQFADRVFDIRKGSSSEKAEEGINALESWFKAISSPTTISALNIPKEDIPKIAENALTLAKVWRMQDYDSEKIEAVLNNCL